MTRAQLGAGREAPWKLIGSPNRSSSLEWWSNHIPQPGAYGTLARMSSAVTWTRPSWTSLGWTNNQSSMTSTSFNSTAQARPSKSDRVISLMYRSPLPLGSPGTWTGSPLHRCRPSARPARIPTSGDRTHGTGLTPRTAATQPSGYDPEPGPLRDPETVSVVAAKSRVSGREKSSLPTVDAHP